METRYVLEGDKMWKMSYIIGDLCVGKIIHHKVLTAEELVNTLKNE